MDVKFAPNNDLKLFTTAITSQFYSGGVVPLVFGTYAEANKETHELIKFCALTDSHLRIFLILRGEAHSCYC